MLLQFLGSFLIQLTLNGKLANYAVVIVNKSFTLINAPCRADKAVLRSTRGDWRFIPVSSSVHRMITRVQQAALMLINEALSFL